MQVLQGEAASTELQETESNDAFNRQFVCLREKKLEMERRVERFGAEAVLDHQYEVLERSYGDMATNLQAFLSTLTPPSD